MQETHDELAGIVYVFGALTREELGAAVSELAFKRGESVDDDATTDAIDAAVDGYFLVETTLDGEAVLVAGPAAFPEPPERVEDLPHILDIEDRTVARKGLASDVLANLEADAADAIDAGDESRALDLREVSYDLESWAAVDASSVRDDLDEFLE